MKIYGNKNGFTIIEVIAILVIVGILAVAVASRLSSTNENNLIAATDTLTSHLRLAQARAMSTSADTGSVWGVRFTSTTQYHLFYCATASACDPVVVANQIAFPGAGSIMMDLAEKRVQVTNGAGILAFNRFGTPYTNAALTTILAGTLVLNLQDSSGRTRTINITPQTGMITS